jgi:hypothetical protein
MPTNLVRDCPCCHKPVDWLAVAHPKGPIAGELGYGEYYGDVPVAVVENYKALLAVVVQGIQYNGTLEMLANMLAKEPEAVEDNVPGLPKEQLLWARWMRRLAEAMYTEGFE